MQWKVFHRYFNVYEWRFWLVHKIKIDRAMGKGYVPLIFVLEKLLITQADQKPYTYIFC